MTDFCAPLPSVLRCHTIELYINHDKYRHSRAGGNPVIKNAFGLNPGSPLGFEGSQNQGVVVGIYPDKSG